MNTLTALFLSATNFYNLPPGLLSSVCYVESRHNVQAVHTDDGGQDSLGVCQIQLRTARSLGFKGSVNDLMRPINNIGYAAAYLRVQLSRYRGNVARAVIAYNRGNAKGLTTTKYQTKVFKQWGHNE